MTKDEVLSMLIKADGFISGENISAACGVSRAAVNMTIKQLRSDGCEIEAVTNRGYRLTFCPDRLFAGEVYSFLDNERTDRVMCVDVIDSTNKRLKEMAQKNDLPEGTCLIANEQTEGRGRLGRSFISPPGTGIYMSMLVRPRGAISDIGEITAWTAVAVHNAILKAYGVDTGIKWVNDLFIGGRKMTGILTEMTIEGEIGMISNVIIGIGVNVNQEQTDFPDEIADTATSIKASTGLSPLPRAKLAAEMIRELDKMISLWPEGRIDYLETYRRCCITLGNEVTVSNYATGETKEAFALDINDDFSLKVRYRDGSTGDVISGEVSVLIHR